MVQAQGDTITYNVGSFAQQQDPSIGDVLKRMPGIEVANNGKIQYQGEGSKAFVRYRDIDEEMKQDLVNILG